MKDGRDKNWTTDEDGRNWMTDSEGNILRYPNGEKVPGPAKKVSKPGEFTLYDDSQGNCALCGRLSCKGTCLK